LPRNRAGYGIESLLKNSDARVKPVTIAVERVDRGRQSPRLVLALFSGKLELLRLPYQIGRCGLFVPQTDRGLVGEKGEDDGADRRGSPGSEPPEGAAVKLVFLGEQAGERAAGFFGIEAAAEPVGILRHEMSSALLEALNRINR
jgi:hypothetical protein